MTDVEFMRLHVQTLFRLDASGRLVATNEAGGRPAPRFFLGRTADGNAWWFRADVGEALASELRALCEARATDSAAAAIDPAPFVACLDRSAPVRTTWAGPAFRFPSDLPGDQGVLLVTPEDAGMFTPYLEAWAGNVGTGVPMTAMLVDGKAVSVCCSVRVTAQAHEAGVETHHDFRGRGYAVRTVAAWAAAVRAMQCIPLFSTSWDNGASRELAKKLGLIQYGADLHIT